VRLAVRNLLRASLLTAGLAISPTLTAAATLRIASADWPPGLGNPYGSIATSGSHTRAAILDPLVRLGPDGQLEPALALSWTAVDATTWRFKLRPDVRFSNGEPFDANAVKAAIDWLRSPAGASQLMAQEVRAIKDVRIVDPLTVDIVTARTDAVLPKRLTLIMMVPPKAWAELGPEGFTQTPIGSGAYILKDWGRSTGKTIIEANPASWRKPVAITRVELSPLKEPVSRIQALSSGQVDVTQGIGHDDLADVEALGFKTVIDQDPQVMALALRNVGNAKSPLQDVRVRQALNYAVNKEQIARDILKGTVQAVGQGAIPGVTGYNPDIKPYPYDPARAKALLAEAGYAKGFKLTARVQVQAVVSAATIYSQVAADLQAVGVTLESRAILGQDWVRMYTTGDWGGADVISVTWNAAAYNDTIRALESFSCTKPGAFFCAPELTPMIEASSATLDTAGREKQLQAIMARYHDLAPTIFLVNIASIYAASPKVGPLIVSRGGLMFERMSFAK
jgi:peptide/nickel transport system substrate-binding protein